MILPLLAIPALGALATAMVWASQHGLTTRTHAPQDGEPP